ncbi:MAG: arylsulfatase [Verrucomicrobia bacterium]|nr:arylsulfatase [Verrucomicrobiota bacterium]
MSRLTLCWIACLFAGCINADPLAGKRPNIIVILTDDQGYGDLGRHGNPVIKTPHLDKMYDEAVHFEDFHVSPTCSPTRAALLSGKHEFKNGVTHTIHERERMSLKTTTIAQVLKSAGYTTGIFGKWHLGDEDAYQPDKRGFDEAFVHGAGGIGQHYVGTCADAPGNSYFDPVIKHNGKFVKTSGYCTDVFFGQAMKWIESAKRAKPFFACITPNAPHGPLICPPEYEKMYSGKVKENEAKFLGMVTNIDDNVGKLLARLNALGIEKDTLVIYMNDNGGTAGCQIFNAGMRGRKGTAFNGGTRAMSLWHWPGTLKPGPCEKLTAHMDIFPTLAELAGAKAPGKLDGFSLVPLLKNPQAAWHEDRMLFTHLGRWPLGAEPVQHGVCSVRWRNYLLVREKKGDWGLYDLKADPGETTEITTQHADVAAKLDKAYDKWWAEILPCLENEQAYKTAPQTAPFFEQYYKQFADPGPNNVPAGILKPTRLK